MSEFVTVAQVGEIPKGGSKVVVWNDRLIAIFHVGDEFFAINDLCPHMGASLAEGHVEDGVVTCPWHAWRFRLRDGSWCDNPILKTDSYELRVVDGAIQVRPRD